MTTVATDLPGVVIIEPRLVEDDRGHFAEVYSAAAFQAYGLDAEVTQSALAWNRKKGTLRGLHYQTPPHSQTKLARCTRGALWDVVVDLRRDSPTFRRWIAVALAPSPPRLLYVPKGLAHGYQTLEDDTEVWYQISGSYQPGSERGIRWNDPELAIAWPMVPAAMSARDRTLPLLAAADVDGAEPA